MPVAKRINALFARLGLERAHIAASLESDWHGVAATHPELIASLSLICPNAIDLAALFRLDCPIRILHGEQANGLELIRQVAAEHPRAALDLLAGYQGLMWSDVAADHPREVIHTILAAAEDSRVFAKMGATAAEGEIHGISYRIWGDGPPLLLLPLALAPSQWDSVVPGLAERFAVILLSGTEVGAAAILESRGRCLDYSDMIARVLERADIRRARHLPDETMVRRVLFRGCVPYRHRCQSLSPERSACAS